MLPLNWVPLMPVGHPVYSIGQVTRKLVIVLLSTESKDGSDGRREYFDPRFKRVLWYLLASTRGGAPRAKILALVNRNPANANQIATDLKMDYKTAIHHLRVLSENGLVIADKEGSYGATYFLTPIMEKNYPIFEDILRKIGPRGKDDKGGDVG
ncbi:MAG: ArsR/SmtB family transcription factor [Nitrososphaera sp.]